MTREDEFTPLIELTDENLEEIPEVPAVYEIVTEMPPLAPLTVYVGETGNLHQRMQQHESARNDNIRDSIDRANFGNLGLVEFRYRECDTKAEAKDLQDQLLDENSYKWNKILNDSSNPSRDPTPMERVVKEFLGDNFL